MGPVWQHFWVYHSKLCCRKGGSQFNPVCPVFLGRPPLRPLVGLSFWTLFNQPSLRTTRLCHLSRRVPSTFARSSSSILSKGSCMLTWSLVVTPHNQRIIAQSLHCRRCKSDKVGPRFRLHGAWPGLGSNTYLYLYLNTQISVSVFVFVFENPQDEIFVFVFVFDRRIWVYLTNIFQIHLSFLHFNT